MTTGYSAVDCLSFVIMDRLGIREAFVIDRHFTHRFTPQRRIRGTLFATPRSST